MKKLTDGRKPVIRLLPPLSEACVGFSGFARGENRSERMYELLAAVIQRCRRATPQPFYAMRDVAKFFGVSRNTVARIYHRLDRDGVLTLVRSSQSIIAARTTRPRFAVRGVVCMPIWLPGFLYFLDWRKWFSQLEEELSHYHFVLEAIFYKSTEEITPAFVDRVLRFNPDYVLWSWPAETDLMTMQSIADAGVALVIIQDIIQQFPGRVYHTSHERGMRRGLEEWEAGGEIDQIVLPHQKGFAPHFLNGMKSTLKSFSLPYQFKILGKGSLLDYLRHLARDRRTGIIFYDQLLYARLCAVLPEVMLEFIHRHRVMVMRQVTIHLPVEKPPPEMTVDALIFPWKKLARRIAMDLGKSKGSTRNEPVLLEAEWRPQIPLAEVVQTLFEE